MPRRLFRWAKVVGVAVVVAASPMFVFDYVLTHHALREGRVEVETMAERYVARAETVIGEGIELLRALQSEGRTDCRMANRQAMAAAAFNSLNAQQIGIADASGALLCSEPMGSLSMPFELPALRPGDPAAVIGIMRDPAGGGRVAVAALRSDDGTRLVLRFRRDVLSGDFGPAFLQNAHQVRVFLEDGSEWSSRGASWDPGTEAQLVTATARSSLYPIRVIVTASGGAMQQTVLPLRQLSIVASAVLGFAACAVTLWITWSRDAASDDFTRAVEREEFVPYYQPVMNIADGTLEGCEVLVRWIRPDGSIVPPSTFLPYAEATGLIRPITRSLMRRTAEDLADLYAERPALKIGVNLTASHFIDHLIVDEIREVYKDSGIAFSQLVFEVTEQHPLKDIGLARTIINRIQRLGSAVALDDVGTGHGGLAYLQQLGVDIIKIDKLFIDKLGEDLSSDKIVDTLVELASNLGMGIVAEGVEKPEQVELLRHIGVRSAQGYLFSRPLPAHLFREQVKALSPLPLAEAA